MIYDIYLINSKRVVKEWHKQYFGSLSELKNYLWGLTIGFYTCRGEGMFPAVVAFEADSLTKTAHTINVSDKHQIILIDHLSSKVAKLWDEMVEFTLTGNGNKPYSKLFPDFVTNAKMEQLLGIMCQYHPITNFAYDPTRKEFVIDRFETFSETADFFYLSTFPFTDIGAKVEQYETGANKGKYFIYIPV